MPDFNQQVQTWHSGDNTCLPTKCRFDARLGVTRTLSLLVLLTLHQEVFLQVLQFSPLLENQQLIRIALL